MAKLAGALIAGYMVYNGGKNAVKGAQKYYDSTTEAEAKAGMSQAMDGAVEVAAALPAFGIIKGGAAKGKKMASKKAETPQNQPAPDGAKPAAEPKPVEDAPMAESKPVAEPKPAAEPKPVEEAPKAEEAKPAEKPAEKAPVDYNKVVRTTKKVDSDGNVKEYQLNSEGKIVKLVTTDKNGKFINEINDKFDANGNRIEHTYKSSSGYESTEFYNNGVLERIKRKWSDGDKDDLTRAGDGIYEGIRTEADGTQVRIRYNEKTNETTELGPVEPKPAEEAPKAEEAKPAAEPKPAEEAPKAEEAKPAAEPKPVEEAPKAEEAKPAAEPEPAGEAPKPRTNFSEAKSLSDEKNLKEFISALLKDNPNDKDFVIRFLQDLKTYNSHEFTLEAALKTLQESALLLDNRVSVFAHNGKLYLAVDGAGTYSVKLKAGTKPAAEAPVSGNKNVPEPQFVGVQDGVLSPSNVQMLKFRQTSQNQGTLELNLEPEGIISEYLGMLGENSYFKNFANVQFNYDKGNAFNAIKILKPGKVEMIDGKWTVTEKMQLEFYQE